MRRWGFTHQLLKLGGKPVSVLSHELFVRDRPSIIAGMKNADVSQPSASTDNEASLPLDSDSSSDLRGRQERQNWSSSIHPTASANADLLAAAPPRFTSSGLTSFSSLESMTQGSFRGISVPAAIRPSSLRRFSELQSGMPLTGPGPVLFDRTALPSSVIGSSVLRPGHLSQHPLYNASTIMHPLSSTLPLSRIQTLESLGQDFHSRQQGRQGLAQSTGAIDAAACVPPAQPISFLSPATDRFSLTDALSWPRFSSLPQNLGVSQAIPQQMNSQLLPTTIAAGQLAQQQLQQSQAQLGSLLQTMNQQEEQRQLELLLGVIHEQQRLRDSLARFQP
jgi:hypothetical protein